MQIPLKSFLLLTGCGIMFIAACRKYKDPPPAGDPGLTNHYCNDPGAINYNRGFPGIPDSSVCIYPVDSFLGTWTITDSVYRSDLSLDTFEDRVLSFMSTEDTSLTHLAIQGWCAGPSLLATASKYQRAELDSMSENVAGQLLCTSTDTISGYFHFGLATNDTLLFQLQVNSASGLHIHKGWGIRQ